MNNSYNKLVSSLTTTPGFSIMHFPDNAKKLSAALVDFCEPEANDCEWSINCFDDELYASLKEYLADKKMVHIRKINENQPRYNRQQKLYDYCFIEIKPKDKISFLEKIYNTMKNAGQLFIFLEPDNRTDAIAWEEALMESNYVAISRIDLDEVLVIGARKMHGWR